MKFIIPEPENDYGATYWNILVRHTCDLTPEQHAQLQRALPDLSTEEGDLHVRIETRDTFLGQPVGVYSLLGVHLSEDGAPWAHWHVRMVTEPDPEEGGSEGAADALTAFGEMVGSVSARVAMSWRYPSQQGAPVVDLPIPMGDLPGFSEMKGLRLAQTDDSGDELYSMIIDLYGDTSAASVVAETETLLDENALVRGMERALEVAALGLEPVETEG